MSKAQICPVCFGKGKIIESLGNEYTGAPVQQPCHGCGGKGWVAVSDDGVNICPTCGTGLGFDK